MKVKKGKATMKPEDETKHIKSIISSDMSKMKIEPQDESKTLKLHNI
mgnify:CR=1 FL=1